MRKKIDIIEVEKHYSMTEDGLLWSKIKNRWMKPQKNSVGYVYYYISFGVDSPCWVFAHTLVALKYIGDPPSDKHEIDHLDDNRMNNYYGNLRWVTHSQNVKKGFDRGRKGYWLGMHKNPASLETKMLMANAKKKAVVYEKNGHVSIYDSIEMASVELGTYRKKIYLCIKGGKRFDGGDLSFQQESL
jgi:hypothetical protein